MFDAIFHCGRALCRVRLGSKLAQKSCGTRRLAGRGPGRHEGHPGTGRPAPTRIDRDVLIAAPIACPLYEGEVDARVAQSPRLPAPLSGLMRISWVSLLPQVATRPTSPPRCGRSGVASWLIGPVVADVEAAA